jgi:hypothetical protein
MGRRLRRGELAPNFDAMQNINFRRVLALFGYVACLAAAPALAQVGPIQPVLVTEGKIESSHHRPELDNDYSVPVDVRVGADGTVISVVVSETSKNSVADGLATAYMRERKFLPGLDMKGKPVTSTVKVTVNMYKRGKKNVVRVTLKPPPMAIESERVKKMMCADFIFEVNRLVDDAGIRDASLEVLPYMSAHMYMTQKNVPSEVQEKFWDQWPGTLRKIVDRCEKDQLKLYYTEVLVPALDGVVPSRDSETVAAH